jgi:heme oxygenase
VRKLVSSAPTRPFLVLRQRTAAIHRQLEAHLDLLSPALDQARYVDVLRRFATVHAPLERELGPFESDPALSSVDIASRRRLAALTADLDALRSPPPGADHPVPRVDSPAAALGALYVTEGATLGGAVIAAHVRDLLGPATPTAFFGGERGASARRWAEFRRVASALLARRDDVDVAAATAESVFGAFASAVTA